jgi:hypothetical protein
MNISVDMIAAITVDRNSYSQRCPMHLYEITLTDGRSKQGEISSLELRSLIKSVSEERITYRGSVVKEDFKKCRARGGRLGVVKSPLPESVLEKIFS